MEEKSTQTEVTEIISINNNKENSSKLIAAAILLAGVFIAGAILLKDSKAPQATGPSLAPVTDEDRILGDKDATVVFVEYADFQCPFCGLFFKNTNDVILENYVNTGKIAFVYRDFAFLGEESVKAASAARCAGDQGKFWEYHDYLYTHQNGENQGAFSSPNLKIFAKNLGLDQASFDQCLDSGKHEQDVITSTSLGSKGGVQGTPKGFILKKGKIVDTIDGAIPLEQVTAKIDAALK